MRSSRKTNPENDSIRRTVQMITNRSLTYLWMNWKMICDMRRRPRPTLGYWWLWLLVFLHIFQKGSTASASFVTLGGGRSKDPIGLPLPWNRISTSSASGFGRNSNNKIDVQASTSTLFAVSNKKIELRNSKKTNKNKIDTSSPPLTPFVNWAPATAWASLVSFAVSCADSSEVDAALLSKILDNPVNPGINELFLTLFNVFLPLPLILAALLLPQQQKDKVSNNNNSGSVAAEPFLIGSAFLGYFVIGPYLSLLYKPSNNNVSKDPPDTTDFSWFTTTILENKISAGGLLLLLLYLPVAAHLPDVPWNAVWSDFLELQQSSRLVAVSCADLMMLHITAAALIPADYALRINPKEQNNDDEKRGWKLAATALLLPFVGPASYLLWRPQLWTAQEQQRQDQMSKK